MKYGFIKSELTGNEKKFTTLPNLLPASFSYRGNCPAVIDLGNLNICVPCSLTTAIYYHTGKMDRPIDIFNNCPHCDEGMQFIDALKYKCKDYALIGSQETLKAAIVINGPCVGGLPVRDSSVTRFWSGNGPIQGGHAIAIIGYNDKGFIIRNSWGRSYGDGGYAILPYEDFNNFLELWTVIE